MRNAMRWAVWGTLAGAVVALAVGALRCSRLDAAAAARTWRNPKDGMVFVWIPGGEFEMGSGSSGKSDERPVHKVQVGGFWLGQYEVTNGDYAKALQAWGNLAGLRPGFWGDRDFNGSRQPVVGVSWKDAMRYCKWAGVRLPTEAEWEYAAKAGRGSVYGTATGQVTRETANYRGKGGAGQADQFNNTAPVGSFPSNRWGVQDLAGNAAEWVSSLYKPYPYRAGDGRENPSAPGNRVVRGGSWSDGTAALCTTSRSGFPPTYSSYCVGFRCARSP